MRLCTRQWRPRRGLNAQKRVAHSSFQGRTRRVRQMTEKDDLAWISKEKEEGFRGRAFLDNYSECIHACGRN